MKQGKTQDDNLITQGMFNQKEELIFRLILFIIPKIVQTSADRWGDTLDSLQLMEKSEKKLFVYIVSSEILLYNSLLHSDLYCNFM